MKPLILTCLIALVPATSAQAAPKLSLDECKRLYAQIDQVTEQRRKGGSSAYMNNLKKRRDDLRRRFHDGKCKEYGAKLRR